MRTVVIWTLLNAFHTKIPMFLELTVFEVKDTVQMSKLTTKGYRVLKAFTSFTRLKSLNKLCRCCFYIESTDQWIPTSHGFMRSLETVV